MFKHVFIVLTASVIAMLTIAETQAAKKPILPFSQYSIDLDFKPTHKVMAANIAPLAGNELVIIGVDSNSDRWLAIYSYDSERDSLQVIDTVKLSRQYFSFDFGDEQTDKPQKLYFLAQDHIAEYVIGSPQQSGKLVHLLNVESMFLLDDSPTLTERDFARDINADGADDFALPDFKHVDLWLSAPDQQYTSQQIAILPHASLDDSVIRFRQPNLYYADMNLDQRLDIVTVGKGELSYFSQNEKGEFDLAPHAIELNASISGLKWFDEVDENGEEKDQSNLSHRAVKDFTDINGDGLPDLIVQFEQSSGVLERSNDYEFYFAKQDDNRLLYEATATTLITSEETLLDMYFIDLDDNKMKAAVAPSFELGLSKIIGALLSGSVDMEFNIYAMDSEHRFGKKPVLSQEVEFSFSLTSGKSESPFFKLADINGDKRQDVLYSDGHERLKILRGSADNDELFESRAEKYKVLLPKEGGDIVVHDINADGRTDLLMHYSKLDDESLRNTIRVLLAK